MKAEAKPFAGDGVDATGGIPKQRDMPSVDAMQMMRERHGSAFGPYSFQDARRSARRGNSASMEAKRP